MNHVPSVVAARAVPNGTFKLAQNIRLSHASLRRVTHGSTCEQRFTVSIFTKATVSGCVLVFRQETQKSLFYVACSTKEHILSCIAALGMF